ncbi:MAG: metal ABC transporter substrate-binding protein [Candidatus Accumulibacter sp. 66-26]|nr:metal ABC transporter substrate-binding protein [Accumulibacter sp.]OJW46591.1 MAG: metal ABC transporter substrate-binding protein [Candidatus Accumulibacter sp. 66-26]
MTRLVRLLLTLLALACAAHGAQAADAAPLRVVATFSILGDLTRQIGGERVQVHVLVGPNADAHVYQPTPADAKKLAQSSLVVMNGLGFEGWIARLVKSSGYRGRLLQASDGVRTLRLPSGNHGRERGHEHEHDGALDPHAWQDMANAARYVDNIAQALVEVDPAGQADYRANALRLKQAIASADAEIRALFAAIPEARRKVVTSHDAFGYFGRAYGIRFVSPVSVSTDAEASAAEVGRIIRQIRQERIAAVFMENISDPRLLERIRSESGAGIGGTLYSDSLSTAGGPAADYLAMMRHNAQTLAVAMRR